MRTTLLEETIESWEYVRAGLLAEADQIPDGGYDFRPHPEARTLGDILVHVVESGLMMAGELCRLGGDFTRKPYGELMAEHAGNLPSSPSPEALRALLADTGEEGVRALRKAGEIHMLQTIRRFDGMTSTRLAWMSHGIAHEEYHRGQVALYARLQGIVPALTKLIQGDPT